MSARRGADTERRAGLTHATLPTTRTKLLMPNQESNSEDWDPKMVAAAVAALLGVLFVVPLAVGAAAFWLLRRRLSRTEFVVVALTGAAVCLVAPGSTLGAHFAWIGNLVTSVAGDGNLSFPPVVGTLALAAVVAGAVGAVASTRIGARIVDKIQHRDDEEVVPTDNEKRRLSVVRPSRDQRLIDPSAHRSTSDAHRDGGRVIPLGVDRRGAPATITEDEIKTHMVVIGSTGSGKTVTLSTLAASLADLGWSVVMLDLKEDTGEGGLRDFLRNYTRSHVIPFQEIALSNPNPTLWFNPLSGMAPDEASNAIMSLQTFDDGYWQAINRKMIGQTVQLFYKAHRVDPARFPEPDMYSIGKLLGEPDIKRAAKDMVGAVVTGIPGIDPDDFSTLTKPSDDERKSASGLGARIVNMYASEAGSRVLRPTGNLEVMDVTRDGICYIGLNTLGLSELARVVSTSVLLRLAAYAGQRTTGALQVDTDSRIAVIIDEANWIDRTQVQNLLSRARSAGIAVVLATQGPQDWNDENGQDWDKVVNNVNVGVIMKQGTEEAAEMCADFIGRRERSTLLSQVVDGSETGNGSMRTDLDHIVPTNQIRELGLGEAILKASSPKLRTEWMKVNLREAADVAWRDDRHSHADWDR